MAAGFDGTKLHRQSRLERTLVSTRNGKRQNVLGSIDQSLEHHVLYRQPVPFMERKSLRRRPEWKTAAACRFQPALTSRTARTLAESAERAHSRRAAGAGRADLRRNGAGVRRNGPGWYYPA